MTESSNLAIQPNSLAQRMFRGFAVFCKFLMATIIVIAVVLYIVGCPLVSKDFYKRLLFPRCMQQTEAYKPSTLQGVTSQDLFIDAGGHKLHARVFEKPGAHMMTIMHHGQCGNLTTYEPFADLMLTQNTSVLMYDYEGYGRSDGTAELDNLINDGNAVCHYVTSVKHVTPDRLVQLGISLGTGVACNVAKTNPSAAVILMSPYANFFGLVREDIPILNIYPDWLFPWKNIETISFVSKPHPPILMFHGCMDSVIHVDQADTMSASGLQPIKYLRWDDVGHTQFLDTRLKDTTANVHDFLENLSTTTSRL